MKLGAVILMGDFNKGAEREAAPNGPSDQRRISPLEAAFSHANIPWPTSDVTPLWGPGCELHGGTWPDCCGCVVLPELQGQWLVMRPGNTGLRTTDQTWHYERFLHPKKRGTQTEEGRLSRRLEVLAEDCAPHQQSERPASYVLFF